MDTLTDHNHMPALNDLRRAQNEARAAEERVTAAVDSLREQGATWIQIANALGITRQTASARYGRR